MLHRLLAAFGWIAYAAERAVRAPLGFLDVPVSGVLLAAILLGAGAALTAAASFEAIENQPEPQATTVAEIVNPAGERPSGWVAVDGVLAAAYEQRRDLDGDDVESPAESVFYYVMTDAPEAQAALLVRSQLALDSLAPQGIGSAVTLTGVLTSDPRVEELTTEPELATALEGAEYAPTRFLVEGSRPPVLGEPSFVPSVGLGLAALVLVASRLVGYPVFRASAPPRPWRATGRLRPGDAIALEIHGEARTPHGRARVRGAPGRLASMAIDEFTRRRWQYWGSALDAVAARVDDATLREAAGADHVVALDSGYASILLPVGWAAGRGLRIESGEVFTARGSSPGGRVRGADADLVLAFRSEAERDRALGDAHAPPLSPDGGQTAVEHAARAAREATLVDVPAVDRPWTIALASALLVLLAVATLFGTLTTERPAGGPEASAAWMLRLAVGVAAALGLAAGGIGLFLGREWGRALTVNLAIVGALVALVSLIASQVCLQPVGPTYSCEPELEAADRLVSLLTLAALAFSVWAVARAADETEEALDPAGSDELRRT